MNDAQIERLLRQAPRPPVPFGLKQELLSDIRLVPIEPAPADTRPLWRRWFPALAFGVLLLGCLVVLGMQTSQLFELRRENEKLRAATLAREHTENAASGPSRATSGEAEQIRKENEELATLREEVARLRASAQDLSALRSENQRLQSERRAAAAKAGAVPEEDPLAAAQNKTQSVHCINNIKQIGLAARIWANAHNTDLLPTDFVTMKNELPSPRMLTCSGDPARKPAMSWDEFDGTSVTYEMLSPGGSEREPTTVYIRCPIHGHIGLTDGSAHMNRPNLRFITEDGKVKLAR